MELRDKLRDVVFKCAGGISNMGEKEVDSILTIFEEALPRQNFNDIHPTNSYPYGVQDGKNWAIEEVKDIITKAKGK